MNGLRIRPMRPDEISIAVNWAAAEGWNPGLVDGACFAAADPEGFFIGELDGTPAATVSCVNYGASFAFLGFYIVREDLRGRGYGLRIWKRVLDAGKSFNVYPSAGRPLSIPGPDVCGASNIR
jgi:GNAT superfamily N-acetyltransferase